MLLAGDLGEKEEDDSKQDKEFVHFVNIIFELIRYLI